MAGWRAHSVSVTDEGMVDCLREIVNERQTMGEERSLSSFTAPPAAFKEEIGDCVIVEWDHDEQVVFHHWNRG